MLLPREIRITAAADTVINYFIMAVAYFHVKCNDCRNKYYSMEKQGNEVNTEWMF